MKNTSFVSLACLAAAALHAQNNPTVTQADTTRLQRTTDKVMRDAQPGATMPSLYEDESADVGPQTVLRAKKPTWFRASVDAQAFYTDNMLYQEKDKKSAGVAVTSVEGALTTQPCITSLASYRAEVGYRHQFFNYFGHDHVTAQRDAQDYDFDSSTVFLNALAQTKHYQFGVGVDYTRLLGFVPLRNHDYEEFYSEWVPRWSVQRNFRVCDQSMLSLAYLGSYHFTREGRPVLDESVPNYISIRVAGDRSERWEHTFLAAYSLALPHNFVAQPFYRFQLNDFAHADTYVVHTLGLSAGWYPCANFSVRGFVGYNWSDALGSHATEYTKLDTGAGVTATLRF